MEGSLGRKGKMKEEENLPTEAGNTSLVGEGREEVIYIKEEEVELPVEGDTLRKDTPTQGFRRPCVVVSALHRWGRH